MENLDYKQFPRLAELYLNASKDLGHDILPDVNSRNQVGVVLYLFLI